VRHITFYIAGESPLHRLHPSTKLVLYAVLFVLVSVLPWQFRWLILAIAFSGLWLCGISPAKYRAVLAITGIATLTAPLLQGLWPVEGDPVILPLFGSLAFHRDGLQTGLAFGGLYASMAMLTIVVLTTTRTWELAEAPTMLGAHHAVGFAMAYAFRYMPEVATRYLDLMDVWRTRGVNFNQGWPWDRFWVQCRLLTALLILEFSQVRAKSNAVEARGFSLALRPTYYILPAIPRAERVLFFAGLGVAGVAVAIRVAVNVSGLLT
jgi:energy-coupling factor transporter transmembrane protein EcfT